jgi:hypothetical protein
MTALYKRLAELERGGTGSDTTPKRELLGDPKLREKMTDIQNQITQIKEDR